MYVTHTGRSCYLFRHTSTLNHRSAKITAHTRHSGERRIRSAIAHRADPTTHVTNVALRLYVEPGTRRGSGTDPETGWYCTVTHRGFKVEFMARHVPPQAKSETSECSEMLFIRLRFISLWNPVHTLRCVDRVVRSISEHLWHRTHAQPLACYSRELGLGHGDAPVGRLTVKPHRSPSYPPPPQLGPGPPDPDKWTPRGHT